MPNIFRKGLYLIKSAPTILVPVVFFLALDEWLGSPNPPLEVTTSVIALAEYLANRPWIIVLAATSFVIKMTSVFFSNADMHLAIGNRHARYSTIVHALGVKHLSGLLVGAFLWTSVFCAFGLGVIALSMATIPRTLAICLSAAVAMGVFPLYYLGISLGSLAVIVAKTDGISLRVQAERAWTSRERLYGYYFARSVIDCLTAFGVPAAVIFLVHSKILGIIIIIIVMGAAFTFTRASFMVFKRSVLLDEVLTDRRSGSDK